MSLTSSILPMSFTHRQTGNMQFEVEARLSKLVSHIINLADVSRVQPSLVIQSFPRLLLVAQVTHEDMAAEVADLVKGERNTCIDVCSWESDPFEVIFTITCITPNISATLRWPSPDNLTATQQNCMCPLPSSASENGHDPWLSVLLLCCHQTHFGLSL